MRCWIHCAEYLDLETATILFWTSLSVSGAAMNAGKIRSRKMEDDMLRCKLQTVGMSNTDLNLAAIYSFYIRYIHARGVDLLYCNSLLKYEENTNIECVKVGKKFLLHIFSAHLL